MTPIPAHFRIRTHPIADPRAVITTGKARFTVLTSRLLRLEYCPLAEAEPCFEDRPSQIFWHRHQPVPEFQVVRGTNRLEILTEHLHLRYIPGGGFDPERLSIEMRETGITWHHGDPDPANLGGTARTLDQVSGQTELEPGLLSRQGWVVVDDSGSPVFNSQGWLEARETPTGALDLYFFGYGRAFQECLVDFRRVSGPVPLIPRFILGNWWSRYWAYTQEELSTLMLEFQANQVPLSVCIVDMDWHLAGWTGYTWNRELFPDPQGFVAFLHELGLKTALNLHPAKGIGPHEATYTQMATALGIDPGSNKPIPFDLENPRFARAYFTILHQPQEAMGVDFWWMDWQQGNPVRLPGLNLLWWINHLHFHDLGRDGEKRSFVFSRWGGLGNHRYPIGFSGDTVVNWGSLAFQPYFTATAANAGYGWWSHDIGGHMDGIEEAELYTRWVQYGVFSPILRLHSTNNPYHERRPWGYDSETLRITRSAMQLRHALIPYIYSMAWRDHRHALPLVRPMYHLYPESEEAYACPNQYAFGSELIAAPFVAPRHAETRLSRQVVWLPGNGGNSDWYDFFTGTHYAGDGWQAMYGGLDEIPLFARAGAIVPLAPKPAWGGIENPQELTLHVFPSADNRFELYEDDGASTAYLKGIYAITPFSVQWEGNRLTFEIHPADGHANLLPPERDYTLIFHSLVEPSEVAVHLNDALLHTVPVFDPDRHELTIPEIRLRPGDHLWVRVESTGSSLAYQVDPRPAMLGKLVKAFRLGSYAKWALAARFGDMLTDPGVLATYLAVLSKAQLRALLETLTSAGVEHITTAGEELIVLWNNHQNNDVRYERSTEQTRVYDMAQRFHLEKSPLPRFKAIRPASEPAYPALLQVHYNDLMKIVVPINMADEYPRPEVGLF